MLEDSMLTASDLMTTDVATVHPETPLLTAVRLMVQRRVSGVPVVDDSGKVVGILSEGDLVRWREGLDDRQVTWLNMLADGYDLAPEFLAALHSEHNKVRNAMSKDAVITVSGETSARDIASLMHTKHVKRVPVLQDGKLVGIVARSDLVRAFAERMAKAP